MARYRGITDRAARKALKRRSLDGRDLIVRHAKGKGGPKGLRYEVLLDSLPADLQARYRAAHPEPALPVVAPIHSLSTPAVPALPAPATPSAPKVSDPRLAMILALQAHPPRSAERARAISAFAARSGCSESSIRAWLRVYDAGGIAALERKTRADKGRRLVIISRRWDQAVPFDDEAKRAIAAKVTRKVRSLWGAGAPGWRHIQRAVAIYLSRLTREAGMDLPERELLSLCAVPRAFISRERRYRTLGVKDKDAKAFSDRLPRIRRDYGGLAPNDLVIGDVHPVDIRFLRPDGTVQPIRLIAWLDGRTNRLIGHVLFPEKGTGVRMEHAAFSFACMMVAWGVPKTALLDNGGEYNVFDLIRDAMALAKGHDDELRTVIKALPYNAQAKKIEAFFRVLEQQFFSKVPGWIGGNRMAAKTHNVGKAPRPFPGTREELHAAIQRQIAAYNATPQDGLDGLSPNQAWQAAVDAGWRPIAADMATLQTAFAREDVRKVGQGEIRIANRFYTHDALCARPDLEKARVRVPVFGDTRVAVYDPDGRFICHAEENEKYGALDVAGARESARRKRLAHGGAEALRADTDPVDFAAEAAAFLALNPPPAPPEPAGWLGLSPELAREAEARRALPATRRSRDEEAAAERAAWRAWMQEQRAALRKTGTG